MAKKQPFSIKFTDCFHSPTIRCLLFSWKITLKIESLQIIYLILLLMSWELFRQKLTIMRKINIMGVVFKLPHVSIWDAIRDIEQCNTAIHFSFGVLSPSGELQTKKVEPINCIIKCNLSTPLGPSLMPLHQWFFIFNWSFWYSTSVRLCSCAVWDYLTQGVPCPLILCHKI